MDDGPAGRDVASAQATAVALVAIAVAVARDSLARTALAWSMPIEATGYLALLLLSFATIRRTALRPRDLGIGPLSVGTRILGSLILAAVFAAPAVGRALRWEHPDALWLALVAAPAEELLCRGVIFALVARRCCPVFAVVASAVAFAAMHAAAHPPLALVAALAAGLVLGAWRAVSGDLVAPVAGHLLADVVASVAM